MTQLNPVLFEGSIMKPAVREKLLEAACAFVKQLKDDNIDIIPADIRLVGSNAGFDYRDGSDIDLHIVVDFEAVSCSPVILQAAFNAERSQFNSRLDIKIKNIPVELYVEDVKAGTESEGIYSILADKWIKEPKVEDVVNISEEAREYAEPYFAEWCKLIDNASKMSFKDVQHLLNRLYMMRKNGLETGGRYAIGNYLFKELRYTGYLDKLKQLRDDKLSKKLSLESRR